MTNKKFKNAVDPERSAVITIAGTEYELILTTRATKEISKRYGGLDSLGEKLMRSENFDQSLEEIVWLIALLANQSIMINNLKHPDTKREPITEDIVELLTTPLELASYKDAISEAMLRGTARNIESEPEGSNASGGGASKNGETG